MKNNTGAQYEISVDGVPRSYRERKELALQGRGFELWASDRKLEPDPICHCFWSKGFQHRKRCHPSREKR